MKIAIVGTSNSVLTNGYAPLYQAIEYPHQVDNYSLGGTICQYLPFAFEKYDILKRYDFLITDCCPNDSNAYHCKQRSADWLYNEIFTILSLVKETQIKHLHLIFPFHDSSFMQKMHVQICEELSIPYLDIGAILSPLAAKEDLFQDIHHISPFYAKQAALLIKEKRKEICNAPFLPSPHTHITKKYTYFDLVKNFQNNYPVITRATSLLAENFIQIKNKQELSIDKLPALHLEGLCYYTNKDAGIFNLSSENCVRNYSLYFPTADYIYYQAIPQDAFPVQSTLKIQSGFNKKSPSIIIENNAKPERNDYSELWISSLLFSKEINAPLTWEEKHALLHNENDTQRFEKIYFFMTSLEKNMPAKKVENILPEYIVIAASLFPQNSHVRKHFLALLKTTENPFYLYYFVQFYLIPRKKYSLAIKLLEKALQRKEHILFIAVLVSCCLHKNLFAKALTLIKQKMPANHITTYKLLCRLAVAMQNTELFFLNAKKILSCNSQIDYLLFLASSCIKLKAFQEAVSLLNTALEDQRNFRPDNREQNMQKINALMQEIKEQG